MLDHSRAATRRQCRTPRFVVPGVIRCSSRRPLGPPARWCRGVPARAPRDRVVARCWARHRPSRRALAQDVGVTDVRGRVAGRRGARRVRCEFLPAQRARTPREPEHGSAPRFCVEFDPPAGTNSTENLRAVLSTLATATPSVAPPVRAWASCARRSCAAGTDVAAGARDHRRAPARCDDGRVVRRVPT
jgi:hypothetical protein